MTGKILVLTAIDDELDKARAPEGIEAIYTGVGKVNAAMALTEQLAQYNFHGRPMPLVVNFGTAGSRNFPAGAL